MLAFQIAYEKSAINPNPNSVNCDFSSPPTGDQVCRVSMGQFGKCTALNGYGYNSTQPCIFLKLNRVSILYRRN